MRGFSYVFHAKNMLNHGHLHTGQLCYTPGVDFLDHNFFDLKNSGQDLSYEGSNFILSSLEVGD